MKNFFFAAVFLIYGVFLFADPTAEAKGHYTAGTVFYDDNDYNAAIREFSKAIELYPEYTDAYIGRGNSWDNKGDEVKAMENYLEASKYDKNFTIFAHGYECVATLEEYDEGIESLTECVKQGINVYIAYCMIGNAYLGKDKYDKAIINYNEAIKMHPNYFQAYFSRGSAYVGKGNIDAAIENLLKAAELCPDYVLSFYYLGMMYNLQGDTKKSEEMFNIYKNVDPDSYI